MKNILFTFAICFLTLSLSAQTEKANLLVGAGGNLDFSTGKSNKDQDDAETNFALDARVGYFIMDGLAAGLDFGFGSSSQGDFSSSTFGVGPFARFYLENMVFAELGYKFGSSKVDFDGDDAKASSGDLGIGVGYAWMISDRIALEPLANFHLTSFKPDGADESISGSNFSIDIGFSFYLD